MRIALVIERYDSLGGGAERWTDQHARRLLQLGHDVHLVAREFRGEPEGAVLHPVNLAEAAAWSPRLRFAAAAEKLLQRQTFDVVHDMGAGWSADLFMPHHGTRVAGFEQNTRLAPPFLRDVRRLAARWLPRYREFNALERRQYQLEGNKTFVAISHMVEGHMREFFGVPKSRIRVVHNGVDVDRFRPARSESARQEMRRGLGVEAQVVFLFVALNFRLKGLDPLLSAMGKLRQEGSDAVLWVAGTGDIRKYRKIAAKNGCESAVRFLGSVADPVPYYQAADVYVQPTYYDPCSLVVLEAFGCGLPVVTTQFNGAGELIHPWKEGCVLDDPDDVSSLADAMRFYLDPRHRRCASLAARRLAERHSLAHNCDELLSLYREVALRSSPVLR